MSSDSSAESLPAPQKGRAPALRASDADRHEAAEVLRAAAGDGRLDLDELDERLGLVFAAKTRADLEPILADLVTAAPSPPVPADSGEPLVLETGSGTIKRSGAWLVPRRIRAQCGSGTVKLDFTEATCPPEIVVEATARSGSVVLIVPRGWAVRIESASTTSGSVLSKANDPVEPGAPLLRVHGSVRSGTVKVRYRYRRRSR
ncbi:MAG: DUF1707 domain-containing protein [Streptosporangiales bacterium]|nr:DUF1707 domain-containing protein [Streptosporangiales bacterium]